MTKSLTSTRIISRSIPRVAPKGFAVLDVETDGGGLEARVIELGVVYLSTRGNVQSSFSTLVHGGGDSGNFHAKRVHGIRNRDLVDAPKFSAIASSLIKSFEGRILFAHNASFDLRCLNYELSLIRRKPLKWAGCTMQLGRHLGHGNLSLSAAVRRFEIYHQFPHQALDDALATATLLALYMKNHRSEFQKYLEEMESD